MNEAKPSHEEMSMALPGISYRVFILRCWAEPLPDHEGISGVLWARRYSVEDVDSRTRYGFASLVELLAFLARTSDSAAPFKV